MDEETDIRTLCDSGHTGPCHASQSLAKLSSHARVLTHRRGLHRVYYYSVDAPAKDAGVPSP
jgi:hypothetical protein